MIGHGPSSLVPPEGLLLGNVLSPVTTHLTFLECPADQAAEGFTRWRQTLGQACTVSCIHEPLPGALGRLAPLTFEHRRHLLVPTESRWTAYFNNYPLGTNVWSILPPLVHHLGCRAVHVAAVPWMTGGQAEEVLEFNVLEPGEDPERPEGRFVGLRNQGGWWRFWRRGAPFSFEHQERYRCRRRRQRLTYEMLVEYAAALGLLPFEEAFYAPCETAGAVFVDCGSLPAR